MPLAAQYIAWVAEGVADLETTANNEAHMHRLKPAPLDATFDQCARLALREAPECPGADG